MTKLRVGLIGAKPGQGWAGAMHVPAIRAVEQLELAAVATRSETSAVAAERAFGVRAFSDPFALIASPDIDIVSVAVKAPEHRPLVDAAIAAGKPVYCEWPLGVTLAETHAMARASHAAGVRTAIGLQGRASPWIKQVRDLVREGYVGRVLSTSLLASDMFTTGEVAEANAYMLDPANGANPLTIQAGHTLDALCQVLGEFDHLSAVLRTSRPTATVKETGRLIQSNVPDQIVLAGTIAGGAAASVHVRAGYAGARALLWEIQGETGFLRIETDGGYIHWRALLIEGSQRDGAITRLPKPAADIFTDLQDEADNPSWNIARLYAALARDIATGTTEAAGFEDAVIRHQLLERIYLAAAGDA